MNSFREFLASKYAEHITGAGARTSKGTVLTKDEFGLSVVSETAEVIKKANSAKFFENYLDTALPSINLVVSNFNSNNISFDEAVSVNETNDFFCCLCLFVISFLKLFGGMIASGLACFQNTKTQHARDLTRKDYLRWADSHVNGFPSNKMGQKVSMIAQAWDEAIEELSLR